MSDREILNRIADYCIKHEKYMWAATIGGIIYGCDFRDFKREYEKRNNK